MPRALLSHVWRSVRRHPTSAAINLLGMAAFTAERRQKEVGVRKVLGATAAQVIGLLSREYALLVGIAAAIAVPGVYLGLSWWLRDFAFRVSLGPWPFVIAAVLVFGIALLKVSIQSWRTAQTDPAKVIRSE